MKTIAAGLGALLLLPFLVIAAVTAKITGSGALATPLAITSAGADIPLLMAELYREAAARFAIPMGLLAAVGKVECGHNTSPACATPNSAGAVGPMQFLPSTWERWKGASGSVTPSIRDPRDAVFAAAAKLAADGAATDPERALWAYNHSSSYVAVVEGWALVYGWTPADVTVLVRAVLHHPHLALRPAATADVAAGLVDPRLLAVLLTVATRHELRYVGPFVTGHTYYVRGTNRPSQHAFGRAVDLPWIDGAPVTAGNRAARAVVTELLALPEPLRPEQIGCPWPDLAPLPAVFSDADHADHLHVSAPPNPTPGLHQMKELP